MYGAGTGRILLDDLQCRGTETSLAQCGSKGYYNHNCRHTEDVGLQCNPGQCSRVQTPSDILSQTTAITGLLLDRFDPDD